MTGKLKEIYNTKLIIIDQLYKSIEEDKNISENEEKNKHKIKNKDFLLEEFEGLFNMENFNNGFEKFVSDIYKNFKKDLINDPFHKRNDRKKFLT